MPRYPVIPIITAIDPKKQSFIPYHFDSSRLAFPAALILEISDWMNPFFDEAGKGHAGG